MLIAMALNLQSDAQILAWDAANPSTTSNFSSSITIYDSLGQPSVITIYFNRTGDDAWDWHAFEGTTQLGTGSLTFDPTTGQLASGGTALVTVNNQSIALDFGNTTQNASPSMVIYQRQDGYPQGETCISVIAPNGGEAWDTGSIQSIEWDAGSEAEKFKVFFSLDNGASWQQIGTGFITGSSIEWNVPFVTGQENQCLLMVLGYDTSDQIMGGDTSDGPFTIDGVEPIFPNGGETFEATHIYAITWTTPSDYDQVAKVKLYYSLNGGITWRKIVAITGNPGTYDWKVPFVRKLKTNCKIKVVLIDDKRKIMGNVVSQDSFTIEP